MKKNGKNGGGGGPSFQVMANLELVAEQPLSYLKEAAWSAFAGPIYIAIPTIAGLSGWGAVLAGGVPLYLLGVIFNIPSWRHAAFALGLTHLLYTWFGKTVEKWLGRPIARFDTDSGAGAGSNAATTDTGTADRMMPLQRGSRIVTLPDGRQEIRHQDARIPQQMATNRMLPAASTQRRAVNSAGVSDLFTGRRNRPNLVKNRAHLEAMM